MTEATNTPLFSELCADIRRRVGDGTYVPLAYMNLARGFRLKTADANDDLVLFLTAEPTTKEVIGYKYYDHRLPGMRWYLNPGWRQDVKFLLCKLGMYHFVVEVEDLPY